MQRRIRIGTRGSKLALAQANQVAGLIAETQGVSADEATEIVVIKTTGDRVQDRQLSEIGGKGLFTKEIEEALLAAEIDIAVHSMKDMPTVLPAGLVIDTYLPRVDPRDAFVSPLAPSLAELPAGARLGTSSLRRAAQIKARRPDLEVVPFRGNVETRLKKLADGVADATLLAMAGLTRLGMTDKATAPVPIDDMLPAIAQGVIGIERREDDGEVAILLSALNHDETALRAETERAFLAALDGSCQTPIAGYAELGSDRTQKGELHFRGMILRPDGSEILEIERVSSPQQARQVATEAGLELKARAPAGFFTDA